MPPEFKWTSKGATLVKVLVSVTLEKPLVPPQLAALFSEIPALGTVNPQPLATFCT
jgi:hypothetical protein